MIDMLPADPTIQFIIIALGLIYVIAWAETLFRLAGDDKKILFYLSLFTFPIPVFLIYWLTEL